MPDSAPGPSPTGASPDELITAWGLITEAVVLVRHQLSAGLEQAGGVSISEFDVMIRLFRELAHKLPMTQLAVEVGLTSGGFTKLADRMETDGRLVREYSTVDRRVVYATLTPDGIELTRAVMARHLDDMRQHLEASLGTEEMRRFAVSARVLRDHQLRVIGNRVRHPHGRSA